MSTRYLPNPECCTSADDLCLRCERGYAANCRRRYHVPEDRDDVLPPPGSVVPVANVFTAGDVLPPPGTMEHVVNSRLEEVAQGGVRCPHCGSGSLARDADGYCYRCGQSSQITDGHAFPGQGDNDVLPPPRMADAAD